jgi:hypothetical protein
MVRGYQSWDVATCGIWYLQGSGPQGHCITSDRIQEDLYPSYLWLQAWWQTQGTDGCRWSPHGYSFGERVLRCRSYPYVGYESLLSLPNSMVLTSGLQILVMLIWKLLPWNEIISLQVLNLVSWKDIIWLSSRHSMVYTRLDYVGMNALPIVSTMKASHLARQNLISGWDSMAICMSMWPRMLIWECPMSKGMSHSIHSY